MKDFFLTSDPATFSWSFWHTPLSSANFRVSSLFALTSWQMFLPPTSMGWHMADPMSESTATFNASIAASDSQAAMSSSSAVSLSPSLPFSASVCLWRADRREKKLATWEDVLHSSALNKDLPLSSLANFMSLLTWIGSAFCPLVAPALNFRTRKAFTFSVILTDFRTVFRAHPRGKRPAEPEPMEWWSGSELCCACGVTPVTVAAHFFRMLS